MKHGRGGRHAFIVLGSWFLLTAVLETTSVAKPASSLGVKTTRDAGNCARSRRS